MDDLGRLDLGLFSDLIRIFIIFGGLLVAGTLIGLAWYTRARWRLNDVRLVAGDFLVVLPWWASVSWAALVVGAVATHALRFGTTELAVLSAFFNAFGIGTALVLLWASRRDSQYSDHQDERKEQE